MSEPSQPKFENAAHGPSSARPTHIGLRHFSAVQFFIILILMFIITPFVEYLPDGDIIDGVMMTVVLTTGVLAVGGRRRTLLLGLLLAIPAITGKWINQYRPEILPPEVFLCSGLLFIVFVVACFLRYILIAPRVNAEVMCAGISVYLLLGLIWTLAYIMVARMSHAPGLPDAFLFTTGTGQHSMTGSNAIYFSYITLSTVGYGDIVPVTKTARMLAMSEAMTGTIYMAVFISRLVALYSSQTPESREPKH